MKNCNAFRPFLTFSKLLSATKWRLWKPVSDINKPFVVTTGLPSSLLRDFPPTPTRHLWFFAVFRVVAKIGREIPTLHLSILKPSPSSFLIRRGFNDVRWQRQERMFPNIPESDTKVTYFFLGAALRMKNDWETPVATYLYL